jgi:hypothetical protein
MKTRSQTRSDRIKIVLEDPCVAQCIAKHLLTISTSTLRSFASISKDPRFHEAIEPQIRIAQYNEWMRNWFDKQIGSAQAIVEESQDIMGNTHTHSQHATQATLLRNLIHHYDAVCLIELNDICSFMIKHKDLVWNSSESELNVIKHRVSTFVDTLPSFKEQGSLFLKEIFP